MKWNGYRTSLIVFAAVVGITSGMQAVKVKAQKKNGIDYALSKIAYNNNGGVTRLNIDGNDDLTILMDTRTVSEGYYTSFFYTDVKKMMEVDQVVAITLDTTKELAMNLNLLDQNGNAFSCKDGQVVYQKEKISDVYQVIYAENGSFRVPPMFSGTIYIPISSVVSKEEVKKLSQLAFVLTQKENEETSLTIKQLQMLFNNDLESQIINAGYQITGKDRVTIPAVGEYQYDYTFCKMDQDVNEKAYSFSLPQQMQGVSVSKEGVLTIHENSAEQSIPLLVTLKDGHQFSYEIILTDSWLKKQEDGSDTSYVLPSEARMTTYQDRTEDHSKMQWVEEMFRILLVGAAVLYLIFYTKCIREN